MSHDIDHIQLTLDTALHAHQQWKNRLQNAVKSGDILDVETIGRDDCCDLGKWLHSNGREHYGHAPEFIKLLDEHRNFHTVASIVANIINGRDYEQVKSLLSGSSQFSSASTDVALAILHLKSAVKAMTE
jgi:hypothetical protein